MTGELDREDLLAQFEAQKQELERLIAEIVRLRRLLDCPDPDPKVIKAEADACAQARRLNESLSEIADRTLREHGIDPEALDGQPSEEKPHRLWREDLTTKVVPTTGDPDDILPNALDQILSHIPLGWIKRQRSLGAQLRGDYLRQPVCLTMGSRPESEQSPVHRFAQSLLVAEDHLNRENWLDFHAGGLLIPMIAVLGDSVELLKEVPGAMRRLRRLVRLPSDQVDSAIYELLVAAACVRKGLKILMPTEGTEPTTDIRVVGAPVPIVLECKMQRYISDYEQAEVSHMRAVCEQIVKMAREEGRAVAVELVILVEIAEIRVTEILPLVRMAWEASRLGSFQVASWGSVRALPRSPYMLLPEATRLYSSFFMENVFGWQPENEEWDGICAQVSTRREIIMEEARGPVCVKWRSESAKSLRMRVRGQMRWLERAFRQIRGGEMGVIYLAYREGRRASVADAQTKACLEEWKDIAHRRSILVPAIIINRVYARALGHGNPDLIENAIVGRAEYAHPSFPDRIPWSVFTPSA